jgi:hypothetical protein
MLEAFECLYKIKGRLRSLEISYGNQSEYLILRPRVYYFKVHFHSIFLLTEFFSVYRVTRQVQWIIYISL